MKIKTDKGTEYEARSLYPAIRRDKAQLFMDLPGMSMCQAAQLDGVQRIEVTNETAPGVVTAYSGYSRLISMMRTDDGVRVTLEREE